MIDVVLCELEGVIAETRAPRQRALLRAFAEQGFAIPETAADSTLPLRAAVRQALGDTGDDETLLDILSLGARRHFALEAAAGLTLAPGIGTAITALQSRVRLGLVTRATRREADQLLAIASLDDAFEVIVAADDVLEDKPHPAGYRAAIDRLTRRRPVTAAMAIEDGIAGAHAARAAGLPCILVGALPAHEALEADAMVESLAAHSLESLAALVGARARVA